MKTKRDYRLQRKLRIRAKISGTVKRPRIAVFRSNKALYVQVIDDETGKTIAAGRIDGTTTESAKTLGAQIAKLAKEKGIQTGVFDRGGYRYHGAIKALAESIREGGVSL